MLTVFQCITMEGWTDILYNVSPLLGLGAVGWEEMVLREKKLIYFVWFSPPAPLIFRRVVPVFLEGLFLVESVVL